MTEVRTNVTIESPVNAVVCGIHRSVGDAVTRGDSLISLDMAKMRYMVTAGCSGKLVELHAKPGSRVAAGTVLAVIDAF